MLETPYNITRYRIRISMSDDRFLLVEGDDDKRLFKMMAQELLSNKQRHIHVHSTQDFEDSLLNCLGCRERVEVISRTIEPLPYASRFVGFVDREFREFEIGNKLKD